MGIQSSETTMTVPELEKKEKKEMEKIIENHEKKEKNMEKMIENQEKIIKTQEQIIRFLEAKMKKYNINFEEEEGIKLTDED